MLLDGRTWQTRLEASLESSARTSRVGGGHWLAGTLAGWLATASKYAACQHDGAWWFLCAASTISQATMWPRPESDRTNKRVSPNCPSGQKGRFRKTPQYGGTGGARQEGRAYQRRGIHKGRIHSKWISAYRCRTAKTRGKSGGWQILGLAITRCRPKQWKLGATGGSHKMSSSSFIVQGRQVETLGV